MVSNHYHWSAINQLLNPKFAQDTLNWTSTTMATLRPAAAAARPAASRLFCPSRPRASFPTPSLRAATTAGVRFKSGPYGYTQAKALVYSKYGEPSDVLQ